MLICEIKYNRIKFIVTYKGYTTINFI